MRNVITITIAVILSVVITQYTLTIQSTENSKQEETAYERVMRTGILRCGYAPWQPGVIVDPNTQDVTGVFPDIMHALAKNASINVQWTEEVDWGNVATALETGKIDAMCAGVWEGADEGKSTAFVTPPIYQPILTIARINDVRFTNNFDHINQPSVKIAVIEGDNSEAIAKSDFPAASRLGIPSFGNNSEQLMSVVNNKADIAFVNPGAVIAFMENNPNKIKIVGKDFVRVYGATIAVNIQEQPLLSFLNAGMHELINSGEIKRITAKYPKYAPALINRNPMYEIK